MRGYWLRKNGYNLRGPNWFLKGKSVRLPEMKRTSSNKQGKPRFIPRGHQVSYDIITRPNVTCDYEVLEEFAM